MIKLNNKYIRTITYILAVFVFTGCANIRITNPPRTATEQFLLSQAAIEAISRFSFDPLFGRKVYVDSSHFAPNEKEFVLFWKNSSGKFEKIDFLPNYLQLVSSIF